MNIVILLLYTSVCNPCLPNPASSAILLKPQDTFNNQLCLILYQKLTFLVLTPATPVEWQQLIQVQPWEGLCERSILASIALHDRIKCENFANLLLADNLYVKNQQEENNKNEDFIKVILERWYNTNRGPVERTWKGLVNCMKQADLDRTTIRAIETNTH